MNLQKLISMYGKGKGTDAMWETIDVISKYLERNVDRLVDYDRILRCVYEKLCGPHYNEDFSREDVAKLRYTDQNGVPHYGAHWTIDQVADVWSNKEFDDKVNDYDKFVAANVLYADLCRKFTEDQILEAAYMFFFADEDWDGDGKVWRYLSIT